MCPHLCVLSHNNLHKLLSEISKLFLHKNIASGAHILKNVLIVFGNVKTNETKRNQRIASFQIVLFSLHITFIMPPVRSPLPHCRMCSWGGTVLSKIYILHSIVSSDAEGRVAEEGADDVLTSFVLGSIWER